MNQLLKITFLLLIVRSACYQLLDQQKSMRPTQSVEILQDNQIEYFKNTEQYFGTGQDGRELQLSLMKDPENYFELQKRNLEMRNLACNETLCTDGHCEGDSCICHGYWCNYGCRYNCYNHGVCVQNKCQCNVGYVMDSCSSKDRVCHCFGNWTGIDCSVLDCLKQCSGNGECVSTGCKCYEGFIQRDCSFDYYHSLCPDQPIGYCCHGFNCMNQGKCHNNVCVCADGYYGDKCTIGCSFNCHNQGICDGITNVCTCDQKWGGSDCSIPFDQYRLQQCQDNKTAGFCCEQVNCFNGVCQNNTCVCDQFYNGETCKNGCPSKCSNHGTCNYTNYQCECYESWAGPICDQTVQQYQQFEIGQCKSNIIGYCCLGINCFNGQCNNGYCSCDIGSYGAQCEHGCSHNCSGNGSCVSAQCVCNSGYYGADCSLSIEQYQMFCRSNTPGFCCQGINCYNGQCVSGKCQCQQGWNGQSCKIQENSQVQVQQLCQGQWENNQCSCLEGTYGIHCAEQCINCTADNCSDLCQSKEQSSQQGLVIGISIGSSLSFILCVGLIYLKYTRSKKPKQITISNQVEAEEIAKNQNIEIVLFHPESEQIIKDKVNQYEAENKIPRIQEMPNLGNNNCSICLDQIAVYQNHSINCPFKHTFHLVCIQQWLVKHKTCPECRAEIHL